jgi:hypothetical protein
MNNEIKVGDTVEVKRANPPKGEWFLKRDGMSYSMECFLEEIQKGEKLSESRIKFLLSSKHERSRRLGREMLEKFKFLENLEKHNLI